MRDVGLVYYKRVEQDKSPAKNIFYLTEAGDVELRRWMRETAAIVPIKEQILQKLWFGSLGTIDDAIALLKSFRDARRAELKYYSRTARKIEKRDLQAFGGPLDKVYWDLVLGYVLRRGKVELEWAESAIQLLLSLKLEDIEEVETDKKAVSRGTQGQKRVK